MAKRSIDPENVIVNGIEPNDGDNALATPQIQKSKGLILKNPNSKLNLTDKDGSKLFLTLEQALKPWNFRRFSKQIQNMLLHGKTACNMLDDSQQNE